MNNGSAPAKAALAPQVVLSGYYGFQNYGDELLLSVLCQQLRERGAQPIVLSANPADTQARHGVPAIGRYDLPTILLALRRAQVFISGGGGLFQDSTGPNSVLYYGGLIILARLMGRPVAHLFQSIGPLRTRWGQWMTRQALRLAHLVAVRDEPSANLAQQLSGHRPLVTSDLGWLSQPTVLHETWDRSWRIGISLRPHGDLTNERLKALAQTLAQLVQDSIKPVTFLLIACQWEEDEAPLNILHSYLQEALRDHSGGSVEMVWVADDHQAITQALGSCHLLFGMRFHSLVMAIRCGTPVFGLIYDPKVEAILSELMLKGCPIAQLETLEAVSLKHYFQHYTPVPLDPMREKVTVALNAVEALYL